ncbi:hypothetical protein LINGRAPRIM_LOCUS1328 [Linum grandiflorum]
MGRQAGPVRAEVREPEEARLRPGPLGRALRGEHILGERDPDRVAADEAGRVRSGCL